MKKFAVLLSSAALALSVSACGASYDRPSVIPTDGRFPPPASSVLEETKSVETEPVKESEPQRAAYAITYTSAKVWVNSIGSTRVQTIVEITNVGSENLYLSSGSYDLEDSDGNLIASRKMVSTYPEVLAPGEKGYMYEETSLDNYGGDGNLTVLPRPDVERAKVELIRYNVTDLDVSDGKYRGVKVLGRVENTTSKTKDGMIYIVAFFYDANGIPIGSDFTIVTETLEPGAKIGFELSGFSLPEYVNSDTVASAIVYAYPYQFQF